MTSPNPLTIIYPAPSPHAVDFFQAIHENPAFDLEVLYCADRLVERDTWPSPKGNFRHEILPHRRLPGMGEFGIWNPGLIGQVSARLKQGRIFALGGGYTMPSVAAAMLYLNWRKATWYYFSEKPGMSSSGWKSVFRNFWLKVCLRGVTGILAHGPLAAQSYHALGFSTAKIHEIPYYMNADEFRAIPREPRSDQTIRFLYCGRLLNWKGLDWMLDAFALLPNGCSWTLDIVGDGPERSRLEKKILTMNLPQIHFRGSVPWDERVSQFAQHDVLLMTSWNEGWGMVVMEALASGMAVIGTQTAGSVAAYIRHGVNGFQVEAGDSTALAKLLEHCARHPPQTREIGLRGRHSVANWTPRLGAELMRRIVSSEFGETAHAA